MSEMTERKDVNIWPGLAYADAHAARGWMEALGFEPGIVVDGDAAGEIRHSEMLWPDGGRVMVSSSTKGDRTFVGTPGGSNLYIVVTDPDAVYARATRLGAKVVREMEEADYGSKGFSIADVEGNTWSFGTYAG